MNLGTCLLALSLASTEVFIDGLKRFSVDVPEGWQFAPQPGDTGGAVFRKVSQRGLGQAMVRAMPFAQSPSLSAFAAGIAAASNQEPGFRLLINEPTHWAGMPALRRRFVVYANAQAKLSKMVEQRIGVWGGIGYVVSVEALADVFPSFEADFHTLFASFQINRGQGLASAPVPLQAEDLPSQAPSVVGDWQGGGHRLILSPAGVGILDGRAGTYRIDQGVLILDINHASVFYEYSIGKNGLRLTGGGFKKGQLFKRKPSPAAH